MIENHNFPWYLQQSSTFTTLYYGFFPLAETASPLGFGDAFNVDKATGNMLFRLGTYWGLKGDNTVYDGLIYNLDLWSDVKVWTGGTKTIEEDLYRNLIKAKSYAFGRLYSLETLKHVLDFIFDGTNTTYEVLEKENLERVWDLRYVNEQISEWYDCGNLTDAVTETIDCENIELTPNAITILLTGERETIRTFIELRGFDLTFIGKPVGIKVNWAYDYID